MTLYICSRMRLLGPYCRVSSGLHTRSIIRSISTKRRFEPEVTDREIPVLNQPIGINKVPLPTDNQGTDNRTLDQIRADAMDYEKHKERRAKIYKELRESSLSYIAEFRRTAGKFWLAPPSYLKPEKALYMPNIWARSLKSREYFGSTTLLKGTVSVVRLFGVTAGELQTETYFDTSPFEADGKGYQVIDINTPGGILQDWLVKATLGSIRRKISNEDRQGHYLLARKGVTKELRASILADNNVGGYIYLVDRNCKIRWAACGYATEEEKANLWKFVKALTKEK